jgi:hypothetical protein
MTDCTITIHECCMLRTARTSLAIASRSRYVTGRGRLAHDHAENEMGHAYGVG